MPVLKPITHASNTTTPRVAFRCDPSRGLIVAEGAARKQHLYSIFPSDWTIYNRHIAPFCEDVSLHDAVVLTYLLYAYALRVANTKNMRKYTSVDKAVITEARENLFCSINLVQFKIASLRCVARRLHPTTDYGDICQTFVDVGLTEADGLLFVLLHYNGDIAPFVAHVAAIPDTQFTLEVSVLQRELEDPKTCRELGKTAGYFTHRKLKFIADGNRLGLRSIHNDLMMRGVAAYYWVRPFYSIEHAINYAKQAIYKHACNTIAYYNDPSRIRSFQYGDTGVYDNTIISYTDGQVTIPESVNHMENAMAEWLDAGGSYAIAS